MSCSRITNYFTTSLPCLWCGRLWVVAFYLQMYAQFFLHHILRNITLLKMKFWNNLHSYFLYFLPCCFTQTQNLFFFFSHPLVHFFLIFLFSFSFTFLHIKPQIVSSSCIFSFSFTFLHTKPHTQTGLSCSLSLLHIFL